MIIVSVHIITYLNTVLFVFLPALKLNIKYISRNKPFRRLYIEASFNYNLCGSV
jgi:energy-converting hydrogenase Eha subunit A